jgi:dimethylhistidine N-methyltransferase
MTGALGQLHMPAAEGRSEFLEDVLHGLSSDPKYISGKHLWDERGSSIFDAICDSESYYVAPLELALLQACAADVAGIVGSNACIVEFGSGASRKVRLLLDALDKPSSYIGIDISSDFVMAAMERIKKAYPAVDAVHVCADYSNPFPALPIKRSGPVLGFFPGSTAGNMEPHKAEQLFARIFDTIAPGWLLVRQDHTSDPQKLKAAYGTPLMAEFHKNILVRLAKELGASVALDDFRHEVHLQNHPSRVEAHLVAIKPATIELASRHFKFRAGESIRTDVSWKHTPQEFETLIFKSRMTSFRSWTKASCKLYLLQLPSS